MRIRLLIVVLAVTLLFVLQNSQIVRVRLLWWSADVMALLLMLLMLSVGFLLGYGVHYWLQHRHRRNYEKKIWTQ
ncbi:lipopolysaccharide assembly protein LapA domain-containing protein [Mariprofundus sp. KV]|uniref:lipopolysaccharide assembly protein LapA domain-containing protein n=1 Tax=Mariprofundus sp. KV TaxID=2608715 RepID=UPI0015A2F831|nr:lipopolysaccharide assembly protein LapA domain-containing protein [Mariprofundus sp. KV]NWF35937.1 DUF1049 domain-containing protein [Mariprofundus sp. KV]